MDYQHVNPSTDHMTSVDSDTGLKAERKTQARDVHNRSVSIKNASSIKGLGQPKYAEQKDYLDQTMKKKWRFPMLFLCAFMVVGPYFCYDFPGSLEN